MHQNRFTRLLYVGLLFALVACQAKAPPAATAIPASQAPTQSSANTPAATAIPASPASATQSAANTPAAPVAAEWKITRPQDIVFGFDSVWVPSRRDPNETTRLDPSSNQILAIITGTGYLAKSAVVVGNAVWVAGQSSDLAPIDPQTNKVGQIVPGNHPRIAYGFNSIWAVGHQGEPLDRVDPATSKIVASIPLEGKVADTGEENGVWVTASSVWVIANSELIKIDPNTNKVVFRTPMDKVVAAAKAQTTVPAGKGTDFLWIAWDAGLIRLDPNTGVGLSLLPNVTGALAVTDAAVWVGQDTGQLIRVSVATNQVEARYEIKPGASTVALGYGSIWLAYNEAGMVQRLNLAP